MAVTFLVADATEGFEFFTGINGTVAWDAGQTHTSPKSIKRTNSSTTLCQQYKDSVGADAGTRFSFYIYIPAYPATTTSIFQSQRLSYNQHELDFAITSAGVMQIWKKTGSGAWSQIDGGGGATIPTGAWHRVSGAWTITDTTHNEIRYWLDGVLSLTLTNATLPDTALITCVFMWTTFNSNIGTNVVSYIDDLFIDNDSSLTDPGDVRVTAKRPFANGTSNGFATQVGAGGSAYGTGHAPQVNERPLSATNGWEDASSGSVQVEEYNIEGRSAGDANMTGATIKDYIGWMYSKSDGANGAQIIVNGVATTKTQTAAYVLYTQFAGSTTYPAGTGADIGMNNAGLTHNYFLAECGIVVAYIPATVVASGGHAGGGGQGQQRRGNALPGWGRLGSIAGWRSRKRRGVMS